MVAKTDAITAMVFGGALVAAVAAAGISSLFVETVDNGVAEAIGQRIAASGGSFESLAYSGASQSVVVEGLVFPASATGRGPLSIRQLELTGVDPAALERITTRPARANSDESGEAEAQLALFDELSVSGLVAEAEDGNKISISGLSVGTVRLAPLEALGRQAETGVVFAEVLSKLSFSRLKVDGSVISIPKDELDLTVSSLAASDFDRGDVGPMAVRDLRLDFEGERLTLAAVDQSYIRAAPAVASIAESLLASAKAPDLVPYVAYGDASLSGLSFEGASMRLDVDRVQLSDVSYAGPITTNSVFAVENFRIPASALSAADEGGLGALGYQELALDLMVHQRADLNAGVFSVPTFRIAAKDMGTLIASAELGNMEFMQEWAQMTPEDFAGIAPEAMLAELLAASLLSAEVSYEDASLVARLLQSMSEAEGRPVEELVSEFVGSLSTGYRGNSNHPFFDDLGAALAAFLADPGVISLRARPPEPVPVALLPMASQAPDTIVDALGLEIEATAP